MILIFNPCTCHANHAAIAAMPMQLKATSSLAFWASSNWPKLGKGFVSTWKLQPWIFLGRWWVGGGLKLGVNKWKYMKTQVHLFFCLVSLLKTSILHSSTLLGWRQARNSAHGNLKRNWMLTRKCTLYTPRLHAYSKAPARTQTHTALRNYRPLWWEKLWFFISFFY